MKKKIRVILNAGSGKDKNCDELRRQLVELFPANNLEAEIFVAESGEDLMKLAEKAAKSDAEIVVAGGGDGTVSGVASKLIGTGKTLGVLPLGTLNHFSKDLRIPQDLAEAVRVLAENHTEEIDVGEVNGRVFINNSSIGLYPQIVRKREQQERLGKGKWSAAFWAATAVLRRYPFFNIKLRIDSSEVGRKTPFVFIGNNEYEMDFLNIGTRKTLCDGKLSVYLLHKTGRAGLFMLALRSLFGTMQRAKDFEAVKTDEITIDSRRKNLLVAFDGEVELMRTPLCYRVRPRSLRVIVPEESK
ncbi:MAG: diacylglycerol kinase family lipid kinase [Acidobacteria bacterium]|nr:diacylglycerol kinase family lipid kinase [Acidobacteriota bacterium]